MRGTQGCLELDAGYDDILKDDGEIDKEYPGKITDSLNNIFCVPYCVLPHI